MAIKVLMPALSPTMTEGNLAKWHKKEGDKIKPGEVIAEIETDKATMEVESADAGILGKIIVPDKTEGVKVNQLIAVLLEAGEGKEAIDAIIAESNVSEPKIEKTEVSAPIQMNLDVANTTQATTYHEVINEESGRIFASPLARRIAEQKGISLASISGSGPHGRIVKNDVKNVKSSKASNNNYLVKNFGRSDQESSLEPHSQMRKIIAKRLLESKQTVPHFYLTADCNVSELLKLREKINSDKKNSSNGLKISVNDFVVKAVAASMREYPKVNASWSDEGMISYHNIDISIAVATNDGLITPIVRNADQKQLSQISSEVKDLARRAKENALKPNEFQGGGFTISNLGMYGVKEFQAIINPPQSCIMAVGTTEKRAVVSLSNSIEIADIMTISISCDHRVIDGATAAEFLDQFKKYMENPALMLV